MTFLVRRRQSNKCGSARNVERIKLHLGSCTGPWDNIPWLLQDASHIYWFHLPKTINQEKTKSLEMRFNFKQIVLSCLGLCTQNLGLRGIDLEPSPKRGSDKINMQKQGRNTQKKANHILQPWTQIWIAAFREVDLEPSAKRGTNRMRALVSLYWSSWSLHLKKSPNQISHKSTKVDPTRPSRIWKKSEIPKFYAL